MREDEKDTRVDMQPESYVVFFEKTARGIQRLFFVHEFDVLADAEEMKATINRKAKDITLRVGSIFHHSDEHVEVKEHLEERRFDYYTMFHIDDLNAYLAGRVTLEALCDG